MATLFLPGKRKSFYHRSIYIYFDGGLTDRVHADQTYAGKGQRTAGNLHDWIFRRGGDQLQLAPTPTATLAIGLQLP